MISKNRKLFLSFPLVGNPSSIQKDSLLGESPEATGQAGVTDSLARNFLRQSSFKLIGILLLLLTGGLFLTACGKKEVKLVSQESQLTQEAFKLAETLKNAYLNNDRTTLERNATANGYKELASAIKSFESAELSFTPTWVEVQDSTVNLTISWKGTWVVKGKTMEERGLAIFILEGKPLKLAQIQRSNPFRQPE
ncbi:MAG: hypothetical protein WA126_01920 [Thermodesulfovibrionales bacterium]